jgi:hypothetical protein
MQAENGDTWLEAALRPRVRERDRLLVFPSQAVADAWAKAAPERFGLGAVETGRFVGWDRFKEATLSARRAERPADRLSRTIWAAGVVARQGRSPFLQRVTGPGRPSPAFVPFLAALPPSLERTTRLAREAGGGLVGRDAVLADLALLREDYAAFLARHGLFEPSWEAIRALPGEGSCTIVAPALIEDFSAYEEGLKALEPALELLHLPEGKDHAPPRPAIFENSYEELRWTWLEVGRLLDRGVEGEDIVVTFPDLATQSAYALRAAELAGVPVAVKGGSPLAASPFGRLIREVQGAAGAGMDFEALRSLLLDRFVSWKEPGAALDLVRFGVERHAYASYNSGGKRVDVWEESFALVPGSSDLRSFYRRLKSAVMAVAEAPTFAALKAAIVAFRHSLLDESRWTEAEIAVVQRSMVELDGLARTEAELAEEGRLPSPLGLFLADLEATPYVPQGGSPGVPMYPYRVSALHPARHHFVLGASQDGIKVSYAALPFLREDQKEALGTADRDASDDFALAYCLSGSPTSFSCATESFTGWAVPHPFFPLPVPGAPAAPEGFAATRDSCPLRAEAAAWRGDAALPPAILGLQARAWASARSSLPPTRPRYAREKASPEALAAVLPRVSNADGALRLSSTTIEEYLACPFAWLLSRGLRLDDEPVGVDFFDARLAGEMAHAALKRLLSAMGELGPIEARRRDAYLAAVTQALEGVLPEFEAQKGPFLVPMFEAYAPLLKDRMLRLVDALLEEPGTLAGELEIALTRRYEEIDLVLEGRIDRLAVLPGRSGGTDGPGHWIIDYKKNRLPPAADLLAISRAGRGTVTKGKAKAAAAAAEEDPPAAIPAQPHPSEELGDWQMACYVALCGATGRRVERASYWSIESAKEYRLLGPGGALPDADYGFELAALDRALAFVASGLRAGDFGTAPSMASAGTGGGAAATAGAKACENCAWKGVCRERYATE